MLAAIERQPKLPRYSSWDVLLLLYQPNRRVRLLLLTYLDTDNPIFNAVFLGSDRCYVGKQCKRYCHEDTLNLTLWFAGLLRPTLTLIFNSPNGCSDMKAFATNFWIEALSAWWTDPDPSTVTVPPLTRAISLTQVSPCLLTVTIPPYYSVSPSSVPGTVSSLPLLQCAVWSLSVVSLFEVQLTFWAWSSRQLLRLRGPPTWDLKAWACQAVEDLLFSYDPRPRLVKKILQIVKVIKHEIESGKNRTAIWRFYPDRSTEHRVPNLYYLPGLGNMTITPFNLVSWIYV